MPFEAQAIRVLLTEAEQAKRVLKCAPISQPLATPLIARGKVTAAAVTGYTVQRLDELNSGGERTYQNVLPYPPGATFLENAYVTLVFPTPDGQPYILATGSGGGGSVTVFTVESNLGFLQE